MDNLHEFQRDVLKECIDKKKGGLSLPMGSGKTLISLLLGINLSENGHVLIIASKSLISVWEIEIKKFFGEKLSYYVFKGDYNGFTLNKYKFIITTADTLVKYYKLYDIRQQFELIDQGYDKYGNLITFNTYYEPENPFLPIRNPINHEIFYALEWGALIIDEGHHYTNINTIKCKSISAICSKHRWILSGTIFEEPKIERILGYHILLNYPDKEFPRNIPYSSHLIKSPMFKGIKHTLVHRLKNEMYDDNSNTIIHKKIIFHDMNKYEIIIYTIIKKTLNILKENLKNSVNKEDKKLFSSYILGVIVYLRMCLVCPLLSFTRIYLKLMDLDNNTVLKDILHKEFKQYNIDSYLNDPKSIKSSRILTTLKLIKQHSNEKIVLFSSLRVNLNVIKNYISNRYIFELLPTQSIEKRAEVLEKYKSSKNGVLLLTYDLGSDGLNLQHAQVVIILDYWWNAGTTQQAISRVIRYGQKSDNVYVYYLNSKTGIEKAILEKHKTKKIAINELLTGQQTTAIYKINNDYILNCINMEDRYTSINIIKEVYS
jgi:SNF2 family DNA or RNA helicase